MQRVLGVCPRFAWNDLLALMAKLLRGAKHPTFALWTRLLRGARHTTLFAGIDDYADQRC
jgi:hypothetical protein